MKRIFLFTVLSAILFASCTSNENEETDKDSKNLTFTFATVNKLENGLKIGPVSSEAKHKVSRVVVYAFKQNASGDYLYVKTFDGIQWPGVGESFYTYTVPEADNLAQGEYKLLAVGREATDQYTLTTLDANTNFNDFSATLPLPMTSNAIFAGSADITVGTEGGGRVSIQLTRQIAGLMGYFSSVPAVVGGVRAEVLAIVLTQSENNGFGNLQVNLTNGFGSVPNGGSLTITAIDLRLQNTTMEGSVEIFTGNTLTGISKLDNSQLQGTYLIPAMNVKMEVVLALANGSQLGTILKSWPVKMAADGSDTFNLVANHFYTLGIKKSDTSTDGDTPVNLNREESLSLSILPEWVSIENLTIE